jgi:hypothetical protein
MDLTRKSRSIAGDHMTKSSSSVTHARVALRESAQVVLTLAALNGLEVLSLDAQNACLTAPATKEKIWTTRSAKFGGEDSDKVPLLFVLCMVTVDQEQHSKTTLPS